MVIHYIGHWSCFDTTSKANKVQVFILTSPFIVGLNQTKLHSKWSKWIMCMRENDLDIQPMKTIKGTSLDEFMTESHALVIVESPQVEDLIYYEEMAN